MAKYDDLPLYKASYDLFLEIFRFVKEFNREYKYTIGESLKKEALKLIILIYKANSREDKRDVLREGRERVEIIRLLVRLTKDLKQISIKKFVFLNKKIEVVSRQLAGWQRFLQR